MKRCMVTILLIGVLLGICLTLVLGAKVRSTPPVGTYEATVQHDGSDVWVLNTSTGDLYRCQISNRSWEIFGCVPE